MHCTCSLSGGKADIIQEKWDIKKCPLMTQSGHATAERNLNLPQDLSVVSHWRHVSDQARPTRPPEAGRIACRSRRRRKVLRLWPPTPLGVRIRASAQRAHLGDQEAGIFSAPHLLTVDFRAHREAVQQVFACIELRETACRFPRSQGPAGRRGRFRWTSATMTRTTPSAGARRGRSCLGDRLSSTASAGPSQPPPQRRQWRAPRAVGPETAA